MVERTLVAVLTTGTLVDAEMLSGHPDASYLLALTESSFDAPSPGAPVTTAASAPPDARMEAAHPSTSGTAAADALPAAAPGAAPLEGTSPGAGRARGRGGVLLGACFIDVATSRVLVGQW